jgi:hypothetical protein
MTYVIAGLLWFAAIVVIVMFMHGANGRKR